MYVVTLEKLLFDSFPPSCSQSLLSLWKTEQLELINGWYSVKLNEEYIWKMHIRF